MFLQLCMNLVFITCPLIINNVLWRGKLRLKVGILGRRGVQIKLKLEPTICMEQKKNHFQKLSEKNY